MFEPDLTGFSYSFTDDGYYEVAYYRAISNRMSPTGRSSWGMSLTIHIATKPECPQGIIQWQHGTFTAPSNGSLVLSPFGVDGRQLLSNPCQFQNSIFTRYNQSELFRVSLALTTFITSTSRERKLTNSPYRAMNSSQTPTAKPPASTSSPSTERP